MRISAIAWVEHCFRHRHHHCPHHHNEVPTHLDPCHCCLHAAVQCLPLLLCIRQSKANHSIRTMPLVKLTMTPPLFSRSRQTAKAHIPLSQHRHSLCCRVPFVAVHANVGSAVSLDMRAGSGACTAPTLILEKRHGESLWPEHSGRHL